MTIHNWALVIQGPMVSTPPPKSWLFQSLEKHEREGRNAYAVEEDCSESISETLRLARPVVRHVVLSTWSGDQNAGIARTIASEHDCALVLSNDPGRGTWSWGSVPDNRRRQIRSTVRGLEHLLNETDATHVVRVRSDQIIDVPTIIATVEDQEGDDRPRSVGQIDYVYVPGILETVPYSIDDFYFAGRVEDIWRFFAAQWESRMTYRGVDSVHVDLVMKHVARNLRGTLAADVSPFELFPVVDARRDLDHPGRIGPLGARYLKLWSTILEHSIKPLPRSVYENITFRGVPFRLDFGRMFLEEWLAYRDDIGEFFRSRHSEAFTGSDFGLLGLLLNYAPECALLDRGDLLGLGARAVHTLRRAATDRYRGLSPEPA